MNGSQAGLAFTIWSEAEVQVRFVTSSGQSGTLSTEASRRQRATATEGSFSHMDARVSGLYLPSILACPNLPFLIRIAMPRSDPGATLGARAGNLRSTRQSRALQ